MAGERQRLDGRPRRADGHDHRRAGAQPADPRGRRRRLPRQGPAGQRPPHLLDDPAAPQRRAVPPGPATHRETWAAPVEGRPDRHPRPGRRHRGVPHGGRGPLRAYRHRAHRGPRLPLVRRVRTHTGTPRPRPRPGNRTDAGPGHHRPVNHRRRPGGPLRRPVGDRGHLLRPPPDPRRRPGPQPHPQAVNRTWAFGMYIYTLVVLWYALHGHRSGIVADRRVHAPWYLSKTDPSFADMLTALRRTLIAARFMGSRPAQPTNAEIRQVQRAWALAAA